MFSSFCLPMRDFSSQVYLEVLVAQSFSTADMCKLKLTIKLFILHMLHRCLKQHTLIRLETKAQAVHVHSSILNCNYAVDSDVEICFGFSY
jgi:hypothetical protein